MARVLRLELPRILRPARILSRNRLILLFLFALTPVESRLRFRLSCVSVAQCSGLLSLSSAHSSQPSDAKHRSIRARIHTMNKRNTRISCRPAANQSTCKGDAINAPTMGPPRITPRATTSDAIAPAPLLACQPARERRMRLISAPMA